MTHASRRFITQSPRIKRTIWVSAVTLTMAAAVSLALVTQNGSQGSYSLINDQQGSSK